MTRSDSVVALLDDRAEDLLRCIHLLPGVEQIMRASLAEPGGHDFEVVTSQTVLYCEAHHRDLTECHSEARKLEEACDCTGVPVPTVSDPTGEAAAHDRVWEDVRDLTRRARRIAGDVEWIVGLVKRWTIEDRVPLRDTKSRAEQLVCEVHLRFGHDRPARSRGTVLKQHGVALLTRPHRLCEWCEDTTRKLGRLPVEVEVLDHVAGRRLRVITDSKERDERRRRRSA